MIRTIDFGGFLNNNLANRFSGKKHGYCCRSLRNFRNDWSLHLRRPSIIPLVGLFMAPIHPLLLMDTIFTWDFGYCPFFIYLFFFFFTFWGKLNIQESFHIVSMDNSMFSVIYSQMLPLVKTITKFLFILYRTMVFIWTLKGRYQVY